MREKKPKGPAPAVHKFQNQGRKMRGSRGEQKDSSAHQEEHKGESEKTSVKQHPNEGQERRPRLSARGDKG